MTSLTLPADVRRKLVELRAVASPMRLRTIAGALRHSYESCHGGPCRCGLQRARDDLRSLATLIESSLDALLALPEAREADPLVDAMVRVGVDAARDIGIVSLPGAAREAYNRLMWPEGAAGSGVSEGTTTAMRSGEPDAGSHSPAREADKSAVPTAATVPPTAPEAARVERCAYCLEPVDPREPVDHLGDRIGHKGKSACIRNLRAEVERLRAWQRQMVEKAAAGALGTPSLDGYRELGMKVAAAEKRADALRAQLAAAREGWIEGEVAETDGGSLSWRMVHVPIADFPIGTRVQVRRVPEEETRG